MMGSQLEKAIESATGYVTNESCMDEGERVIAHLLLAVLNKVDEKADEIERRQ